MEESEEELKAKNIELKEVRNKKFGAEVQNIIE